MFDKVDCLEDRITCIDRDSVNEFQLPRGLEEGVGLAQRFLLVVAILRASSARMDVLFVVLKILVSW